MTSERPPVIVHDGPCPRSLADCARVRSWSVRAIDELPVRDDAVALVIGRPTLIGERAQASLEGERKQAALAGERKDAGLQGERVTPKLEGAKTDADLLGEVA